MKTHDFSGRLFYLVGASGAGKDSLLRHVRQRLPGDAPVVFARRVITRPHDGENEDHIAVSKDEFARRAAAGAFAMQWHANGLDYGIPAEIDDWLAQGHDVLVNGSRGWLAHAAQRYPGLRPVLVHVTPERLAARLTGRGRETEPAIAARLARARALARVEHPALSVIDNNGRLEDAGEALLQLITDTAR